MKKKIFGGIAVLAIAGLTVVNVSLNLKNSKLPDVIFANVEALAQNEAVEQICCNKAFSTENCVIINQTPVKGRRHNC
jgi:hypothetical protein